MYTILKNNVYSDTLMLFFFFISLKEHCGDITFFFPKILVCGILLFFAVNFHTDDFLKMLIYCNQYSNEDVNSSLLMVSRTSSGEKKQLDGRGWGWLNE